MEYKAANDCEIEMSSVLNTPPNFILRFEPEIVTCNQRKNKLGLRSQTCSWTKSYFSFENTKLWHSVQTG